MWRGLLEGGVELDVRLHVFHVLESAKLRDRIRAGHPDGDPVDEIILLEHGRVVIGRKGRDLVIERADHALVIIEDYDISISF